MKFSKPNPPSPARLRLRELIAAKTEAASEAAEARGRISRLADLAESAAPVRAKLAALDASEASAFAAWSRAPASPVPTPDSVARIDLTRDLAEAQSRADAASRAMQAMAGESEAANVKSATADAALNATAVKVALEEMQPLADEARTVMARLADLRMRGDALSRVIGDAALSSGPDAPGFAESNTAWALAGDALRVSVDMPRISEADEYEFLAKARTLLTELRSDSNARLED
jgi:hypothetical protein